MVTREPGVNPGLYRGTVMRSPLQNATGAKAGKAERRDEAESGYEVLSKSLGVWARKRIPEERECGFFIFRPRPANGSSKKTRVFAAARRKVYRKGSLKTEKRIELRRPKRAAERGSALSGQDGTSIAGFNRPRLGYRGGGSPFDEILSRLKRSDVSGFSRVKCFRALRPWKTRKKTGKRRFRKKSAFPCFFKFRERPLPNFYF